jgi:hypothetical protein
MFFLLLLIFFVFLNQENFPILETSKPLLLPLFHEPIWVQEKRRSSKKENANKLQEDKVLISCQKYNIYLFM